MSPKRGYFKRFQPLIFRGELLVFGGVDRIPSGNGFWSNQFVTCQDGPSAGLLGARDRLQKYRTEHPKIFGEVENLLTEEWGL